ncbi:cellobiose-specific PTS system IIC component [Agrilactobacillus composti DSM 18527 = JCM 14202]|uniref:Permease IIC component n=1 Tax=Agrilactobacillus composti DSM 18527 = JCM 14202 TaxID=1423734 RepID=X0PIJ1_9LACO|nr:PTS transporter subunit EIIC [Agrilactobacillus composti]KRM32925.1 cellobiose-specific PTS system IIC component [Agrilactobacillus composti DSM 18527 = JCM 14202]GAF41923.1 PTS system, lactose-specific IIB component [Agrilactobacillus composti DSM 18527 = JCM 14202]
MIAKINHLITFGLDLSIRIKKIKIYEAIRQTFSILFPFVVIGSIIRSLNLAVFTPDGFFASVYKIPTWLPHYNAIRQPLSAITNLTINMIALLSVFFVAKYLASLLKDDDHIVGICGFLSFMLLNYNFNARRASLDNFNNLINFNNLGFKDIFLSIVIGVLIAYSYHGLAKLNQRYLQHHKPKYTPDVNSFTNRGIRAIFPVSTILLVMTLLGFLLSFSKQQNLSGLLYDAVLVSPNHFTHRTVLIVIITVLNNFMTLLGISGPLNVLAQNVNNTMGAANLNHALSTKNLFSVPNPVTLHTLYDTYGNFGGTGMTLALIICILLISKNRNLRQVAKFSIVPGLVNINDTMLLGVPIMFSPILFIPYLLSPLISMFIAWIFINFQWMPPAVYQVPGTTPSFLLGYLGTNGNVVALLVSFLCLGVSVMVYYPFVVLLEHIRQQDVDLALQQPLKQVLSHD